MEMDEREDTIDSFNKLSLKNDQDEISHPMLEKLPQLVEAFNSDKPELVLEVTIVFRKALSVEKDPPIQQLIDAGIVPRLVKILYTQELPILQFEAAWVLTNIASGKPQDTMVVIEAGAVNAFVTLLNTSYDDNVREQSIWGLGNIAGNSAACRDLALSLNALQPILNILQNADQVKLCIIRNATWTLSNLCRGKPQVQFHIVRPALPILIKLLNSLDDEVLTDACWALSYISDATIEEIQEIIDSNVGPKLIQLLSHVSTAIQTPALRTIGNLAVGNQEQTDYVISLGVLVNLKTLLNSPKLALRKESAWTISNILASGSKQIQQVIDIGIVPLLINLLKSDEPDTNSLIKREVACSFLNIALGTSQQIDYIFNQGFIGPLVSLLYGKCEQTINFVLGAILNIIIIGNNIKYTTGSTNPYSQPIKDVNGFNEIIAKLNEIAEIPPTTKKYLVNIETYLSIVE